MLNNIMELEKQPSLPEAKITGHGGPRPNSGRKPGSTQKLTAKDLLAQCEATLGKPFALSLMEGYRDSILDGDVKTRVTYEKIIVDKVATTMMDIEVEDNSTVVDGKRTAFLEAVNSIININKSKDDSDAAN
jgi:hypothetical protein